MISAVDSPLGAVAAAWAIAGWGAVLGFAVARLAVIALEGLAMELSAAQLGLLAANTAFMAWAEGYRGFQRSFSPRAAARVLYLRRYADVRTALLAPFFCVGFYRASRRVRRLTWVGTGMIVVLIILVHRLPQPWRGIIDVGVVVGLSWGLISFLVMSARALMAGTSPTPHEVSDPVDGRPR
ncbi:MAG: hypothetical protein L6Q83_10295, partial [Gammaproteobacteria bacterium]|nr:hypothetical protein [Gammaproteobacteria bacterium]